MEPIADNKKAYFNYEILEKLEAGLVLNGQEVKSLKTRGVSYAGSYIGLRDNEAYWVGAKIPAYQPKNAPADYDAERSRKLLLKKSEITELIGKSQQKGLTLIPLKLYTKQGKIKIEFGLAKGKKKFDKRETIKKRESEREVRRAMGVKD